MNELSVITTKDVEEKLISLRNQKVLLSLMAIFLYLTSMRNQRWSKILTALTN